MNKAYRHELKMLHYKRRLKNYRLKDGEGKFFAFRSHGSPCSCDVCSRPDLAYNRAKATRDFRLTILSDKEIDEIRNPAYEYLIG